MKPPARLLPYIVPKGFIAVDGTSLTVCEVDYTEGWFNFMLVAYTQQKIVIPKKSVGETVNLEVDVLAKYVEKGLASLMEGCPQLRIIKQQPRGGDKTARKTAREDYEKELAILKGKYQEVISLEDKTDLRRADL